MLGAQPPSAQPSGPTATVPSHPLLPSRHVVTNAPQTPPTRTARMLAVLRSDGARGWRRRSATACGWRKRRVQNRIGESIRARSGPGSSAGSAASTRRRPPVIAVADPQIAVIVTSRDRAELLGLALRSVQLQDFTDWECIVVDDASLDDAVRSLSVRRRRLHDSGCSPTTACAGCRQPATQGSPPPGHRWSASSMTTTSSSLARCAAGSTSLVGQPADVVGAYCDWVGIDPADRLEQCRSRRARRAAGMASPSPTSPPGLRSSPPARCFACRRLGARWRVRREPASCRGRRHVDPGDTRRIPIRLLAFGRDRLSAVARLDGDRLARAADGVHAAHPAPSRRQDVPTGRRSSADRRALSAAGFELGYAPQILNYLALLAATDVDRAVELGCRELSEPFRRRHRAAALRRSLTSSVSQSARAAAAARGRRRPARASRRSLERLSCVDDAVPGGHRRSTSPPRSLRAPSDADRQPAGGRDPLWQVVRRGRDPRRRGGRTTSTSSARCTTFSSAAASRRGSWPVPGTSTRPRSAIGRYAAEILPFDPDLVVRAAVSSCSTTGATPATRGRRLQRRRRPDVRQGRRRAGLRGRRHRAAAQRYRTAAVVLGQGQNDSTHCPTGRCGSSAAAVWSASGERRRCTRAHVPS